MMQEMVQEIENTIREATYDMHTAVPGTIAEYDAESGMASVKPEGTITMRTGEKLDYPTIVKVPVVFPQANGQKAAIAYPVKPGDGCLVIICENDLKPWTSHGKETDSNMKFDLTNSVCIPGLFGEGSEAAKKAAEEDAIVIKNEDMEIVVKKDAMEAKYLESSLKMDGSSVKMGCGGCGVFVSVTGTTIEGDLNVTGIITGGGL